MSEKISRRDFLKSALLLLGVAALTGCTQQSQSEGFQAVYGEDGKIVGYVDKERVFHPIIKQQVANYQTTIPTPTETPTAIKTENINPAQKNGDKWILHDSDGNPIELSLPANFTPDADLKVSEIKPKDVLPIPNEAADFEAYLNTSNNPLQAPLAGYMYGTNDYNQYGERTSGPQLPMYSWLIHTGEVVAIPGIGEVRGGPGRAVAVLIINRTDNVYQWDPQTVYVKSGFQGAGRIWNGEGPYVAETEKRLVQHYGFILGNGHPESGFIGQCNLVNNCQEVTFVTAERIQWGNNPDGTPRYQFRLIRAENIYLK